MMSPHLSGCRRYFLPLLTFAFALFQLGAAYRAVTISPELASQVALPLALEFVISGIWALAFLFQTFLLLRGKSDSRRAVLLIGGFMFYSALRLLLFARADYDRQRLPLLLILVILMLISALVYQRRK